MILFAFMILACFLDGLYMRHVGSARFQENRRAYYLGVKTRDSEEMDIPFAVICSLSPISLSLLVPPLSLSPFLKRENQGDGFWNSYNLSCAFWIEENWKKIYIIMLPLSDFNVFCHHDIYTCIWFFLFFIFKKNQNIERVNPSSDLCHKKIFFLKKGCGTRKEDGGRPNTLFKKRKKMM